MESLLPIIDNICRYGLQLVTDVPDRQADLEKNLVLLYAQFFALPDAFDEQDYPDFDTTQLPNLRAQVGHNFPGLGVLLYRTQSFTNGHGSIPGYWQRGR